MKKKLVNLFLIAVLLTQVLPIQQIGQALFNNQFTEEVSTDIDTAPEGIKKISSTSEYLSFSSISAIKFFKLLRNYNSTFFTKKPTQIVAEVLVPPPNS